MRTTITPKNPQRATLKDLDAIEALEHASFVPERQEGRASLQRSITSAHQEVWVLRADCAAAGSTTATSAKSVATASSAKSRAAVAPAPSAPGAQASAKTSALAAAMVLRIFPKTLRIYSIAVAQEYRGLKLGSQMLDYAFTRARRLKKTSLSLEADAADPRLTDWYAAAGFCPVQHLPHYYGRNRHGVRMRLNLDAHRQRNCAGPPPP